MTTLLNYEFTDVEVKDTLTVDDVVCTAAPPPSSIPQLLMGNVTVKPSASSTLYTLLLPEQVSGPGYLQTDGTGVTAWTSVKPANVTADAVEETASRVWLTPGPQNFSGSKTFTSRVTAAAVATNLVELGINGTLSVRQNDVTQVSVDAAGETHYRGALWACNNTVRVGTTAGAPEISATTGNLVLATTAPCATLSSTTMTVPELTAGSAVFENVSPTVGIRFNDTGTNMPALTAQNNDGSTSRIAFKNSGNGQLFIEASTAIEFNVAGVNVMRVTPTACEFVNLVIANVGVIINGDAANRNTTMKVASNIAEINNAGGGMSFRTAGVERMRIRGDGAVTIPSAVFHNGIVTNATSISDAYSVYMMDTSTAARTLTLTSPTAMAGRTIYVMRKDTGTTNALTINVSSGLYMQNVLNGYLVTTVAMRSYTLYTNGTGWFVLR